MVSDQEIASCVESLLCGGGAGGAGEASLAAVLQQAQAKLGVDLSHKAPYICDQMDLFFGPRLQAPPPKTQAPPPPPASHKSSGFYLVALCLVPMGKKKNKPQRPIKSLKDAEQGLTSDYIGGDALDDLLLKLIRSVEVAKTSRGGLPEKIWMKEQFAIGVNDVTRVLERMPADTHSGHRSNEALTGTALRRAPLVPLQAVLVAADCNPKWLTKHIPTLASARQVPILCLKDSKGSSLRLGQVANVRTALAIGIKARDSIINKTIDEVLKGRAVSRLPVNTKLGPLQLPVQ